MRATTPYYGACTDSNSPPTDNLDVSDAQPPKFDMAINTGATGAHSVAADRVTVTEWMPMFGGACGAGVACVVVYGSTGGDDPRGLPRITEQIGRIRGMGAGNGAHFFTATLRIRRLQPNLT